MCSEARGNVLPEFNFFRDADACAGRLAAPSVIDPMRRGL